MNITPMDFRKLPMINSVNNLSISIGAGSVVIKGGQVLLVRSKDSASLWKFPGGHVHDQESIPQAVVRETLEETGYRVEVVDKPFVYEFNLTNELRLMLIFYRSKIVGDGMSELNDEITEVKWFPLEDLPDNCFENVKPIMKFVEDNPTP